MDDLERPAIKRALSQKFIRDYRVFPCIPAGNSADYQGLLSFKQAIPNFDINLRRGQYTGWSQGRGTPHCAWAGVTCADGSVVGLQLLQNASWHRGEPCRKALALYILTVQSGT